MVRDTIPAARQTAQHVASAVEATDTADFKH